MKWKVSCVSSHDSDFNWQVVIVQAFGRQINHSQPGETETWNNSCFCSDNFKNTNCTMKAMWTCKKPKPMIVAPAGCTVHCTSHYGMNNMLRTMLLLVMGLKVCQKGGTTTVYLSGLNSCLNCVRINHNPVYTIVQKVNFVSWHRTIKINLMSVRILLYHIICKAF